MHWTMKFTMIFTVSLVGGVLLLNLTNDFIAALIGALLIATLAVKE